MPAHVALIGYGYWGRNLARNFHELGALAGICDLGPGRAEAAAAELPGVPFTADCRELLDRPDVTAVAIATPAVTHALQVRAALAAGKDVFCEKPLALAAGEGRELVELAERSGRILMVGHVLRYHPAVVALDRLVSEGALGKVRYIYSNRLNIGRIRTEENILWSFAPHDISTMLALLGEMPESVSCRGASYLSTGVPDVTLSTFSFQSGVMAHVFVSWLHPVKEQRLVVVGSEKMAVFDDTARDKLVLYPHRIEWRGRVPTAVKADAEVVELAAEEPLANECRHFLECVASRRTPRTDGREGLAVLRVLAMCQQSLEDDGRAVRMDAGGARPFFAHPTAVVGDGADVGEGTKIWHFCHVMDGARIGRDCSFGQNCHVADGVVIGDGVKVQNNVSIYTGTVIEDAVFLGPSCVLTNVTNPRAEVSRRALYERTILRRGASIGANATVVCGVEVGRYAFVGAGAVVTRDVADYALVVGVPARRVGWMSRHGLPLGEPDDGGVYTCAESGLRYRESGPDQLRCLDLAEDEPLPAEMRTGHGAYREIRGRDGPAGGA